MTDDYCANCSCDSCSAQRIPDRLNRQLQQLADELAERGHTLTWAHRRLGNTLDLWLDHRPMIGNRTIAHVREMAAAMLGD